MSELNLRKDSEWSIIDGELCRIIGFTPFAVVENGKVKAPNLTDPYAMVVLECKKISDKINGYITHKIDFANLWAAFKERGIMEDEEILMIWTTKQYKFKIPKLLLTMYPKVWLRVCQKGALEAMENPDSSAKQGAWWEKIRPLAEWQPEIMK